MSKKIAIALGLILLRLVYLGLPDLFPEEAYYWNYAMHPDWCYLDHPPMVAWLIHSGTILFGQTEFGVRFFAFASSLAAAFFIWRLTRLLYGRAAAETAFLTMQVLPVFFLTGFMITPDAPLVACWSAALYFLAVVFFEGKSAGWIGFGVSLGLGMLSKYTVALLVPSLGIFMLLDPASRIWFRRVSPWFSGLIAAAFFSPVLLWNSRHAWVSFAFQTTDRISARAEFGFPQLLASILVLLTPVGIILAARLLAGMSRPASDAEPAANDGRRILFARVFVLVPLSVFVFFSLTHKVKLNWTGPVWLALVPAMAAWLAAASDGCRLRRAWTATIAVMAVIFTGFLQYLSGGLPWTGYSKKIELIPVGWSELGRLLDARKEALKNSTGGAVAIVGMDRNFIASEAAFYQRDKSAALRETTGAHLFGGNSLMFRFWSPSSAHTGATLLLVAFNRTDIERRSIAKQTTSAGPVEEIWLERSGKKILPIYLRVVSGYRPSSRIQAN